MKRSPEWRAMHGELSAETYIAITERQIQKEQRGGWQGADGKELRAQKSRDMVEWNRVNRPKHG